MAKAYLLLGGNLEDRFYSLNRATELIERVVGEIVAKSSFYECAPWGFTHKNQFLNRVIVVETISSAHQLLLHLNRIENMLGRVRGSDQYIERNIDIDIIFYENQIIQDENLTIPHRKMQFRRFTLEPLNELIPDFIHPVLNKTVNELLRDCEDQLSVTIIDEPKE
ncbi:MAG: 2-amino-4-hydroxy-6-hydroxymethyldihydropteridine diphosphokinase [Bacteroidetes bacterium GWF2_33_38]|nr:MAG: 2-amino-4-hydroxy-6-hydroxymethyldihydropteridine diphosphokinase [Bacteroidetes bacterium GWF2_33_38]OFY88495.1 MAG: 2-amino-4-hydroxy-6-hydroxymethyldihydropteridine diphosphokinase [Bacteroidetes bacterium RIFOXYA2_FULL_33_7]